MSVNVKFELSCTVGMVQLNLNLTEYTWGMGSTRHVFHFTHVQACVCTVHEILTSLYILISKNQALQILYLKHHA